MDEYVSRIKREAEHVFKDIFPQKALELDKIISTLKFDTERMFKISDTNDLPKTEDFLYTTNSNHGLENADLNQNDNQKENQDELHQNKKRKFDHINKTEANEISGCKVVIFPNGLIQCNQKLMELIESIKPYIVHFLDSTAVIKLWIQILIPKVEDFKAELSLQIQEDSLAEVRTIEGEVASYLDHIYKYHTIRGKLISKVAKYPHVGDFKQSVVELDEKMFLTVRLVALELRNHYTTLHDMLVKNVEKIKKPRTNNDITMY